MCICLHALPLCGVAVARPALRLARLLWYINLDANMFDYSHLLESSSSKALYAFWRHAPRVRAEGKHFRLHAVLVALPQQSRICLASLTSALIALPQQSRACLASLTSALINLP